MTVRVAVADDDPLIRRTISAIVEHEDGWELAGVAEDTATAIELARHADVVVCDVRMPGGGALALAAGRRDAGLSTGVVALTGYDAPGARDEMADAGVSAVLLKGCAIEDIIDAVKKAAANGRSTE